MTKLRGEVDRQLTPRELEVIEGVWRGLSFLEIGAELGITVFTVKRHIQNAYDRTGMSKNVELALWYERNIAGGKLDECTTHPTTN